MEQTTSFPELRLGGALDGLKERGESLDDFRNTFNNILKNNVGGFIWHRRIRERYKDGRLTIHLHFEFTDYMVCVNSQSLMGSNTNSDISSPAFTGDSKAHRPRCLNSSFKENRKSVLVSVYDLLQLPERLIPSIVRLNRFDSSNGQCGNLAIRQTIQPVNMTSVRRSVGKRKRRDAAVIGLAEVNSGLEISRRQFPQNIVERPTCVSGTVAHDATELPLRVWPQLIAKRGLEGFVCLLKDESVEFSFFVLPNHVLKNVEMVLCPDDFEPCVI
jgi:hypothetical protein